ncbi:MAG: RNA polymerase factor sigma-32 [bacterium]|nr:RNA polymerase factor sigma-32 [bacterium]
MVAIFYQGMTSKETNRKKHPNLSLAPADPVKHYIWEVDQYPYLTKEEEENLVQQYKEHNDVQAAKKLLMAHLRLVVKIAFKYYNQYYLSLFDLIQEGNLGLILSIKKFNPERKVRFATYAQWWIKAYILKYLMDNYSIIRIGRSRAEKRLFYTLKKAKEKLFAAGFDPDNTKKLAEYMREDEKDIIDMNRRLNEGVISLDQNVYESNKNLSEILETDNVNIEKEIIDKELKEKLKEKLTDFSKDLKGQEKIIWEKRLLTEEPWTLQKLSEKFNISREWVRQIETKLLNKLKQYLGEQKDFHVNDFLKKD